jgi:hypothetical protein
MHPPDSRHGVPVETAGARQGERSTDPRPWKPYDVAPRTNLPDLADLYDRRRPELDWRDGDRSDLGRAIPLSSRPLDEDLGGPGPGPGPGSPRPGRQAIGEPTILDRGHQALRHRMAQPGQTVGVAVLVASPFLLSALVALMLSIAGPLRGADQIPLATVLVLLFQAVMMVMSYALQLTMLGRIWLTNLVALSTLMPLLALQSTFSGIPYVSPSRSSAEPVIMTATVTIIVLLVIAIVSASLSYESPGDAAVLFLPAALIVPVVLGGPASDIPDRGLASIMSVSVAAAIAAAGSQILPERIRPIIGLVAVMVELGALYAARRGPNIPESSGQIVSVLLWAIIGLTVALTVVVPLLARWLRHVEGAARLTTSR